MYSIVLFSISCGILGFVVLSFFDLASLKKMHVLKQAVWITGNGLICCSIVRTCFRPERIVLPNFIHLCGWIITPSFFLLLIYSLFLEIPFQKTYIKKGVGDILITTGTYGLVRHPGVLWFIMFLSGLFFITGSTPLLICLPVLGVMDVLYAIIQEKYFFIKIFGDDYRDYQKRIPMFIPDIQSIKRFFSTFINYAGSQEQEQ